MEDFLVWLFWAVMIGGSIASSAAKAKKKREEEARKAAGRAAAGAGTGAGASGAGRPVKTGPRSLAQVLEDIARQANEQPTPPVAAKPLSRPVAQPVARPVAKPVSQSATQPAATSHDYYSLESEYDAMDGREYRGEYSAEVMEDEVAAYERLAAKRASRSTLATATVPAGIAADATANAVEDSAEGERRTTLQELLGGDFDLRRAVIEAEILTPKYANGF